MSSIPDIINPSRPTDIENHSRNVWCADRDSQISNLDQLPEQLYQLDSSFSIVESNAEPAMALGGSILFNGEVKDEQYRLLGIAPAQSISNLGDSQFCQDLQINYPYMAGSMANGIASVELVEALAKEGLLASFGFREMVQ